MIFTVTKAAAQDTLVVVPTVRDTIPKDSVVTRVQGMRIKSDVVADRIQAGEHPRRGE